MTKLEWLKSRKAKNRESLRRRRNIEATKKRRKRHEEFLDEVEETLGIGRDSVAVEEYFLMLLG